MSSMTMMQMAATNRTCAILRSCRTAYHSSKLNRLVDDLAESQGREKRYVPSGCAVSSDKTLANKVSSLVLSCWKKTIDLVSILCREKGINHVCVDGSLPQADRRAALNHFTNSESTSALIMTIGTGALGYVV